MQDVNVGERGLLGWQYPDRFAPGGFQTALWKAIERADGDNLYRLGKGFPEEVKAYQNYAHGDGSYWSDLKVRAGIK